MTRSPHLLGSLALAALASSAAAPAQAQQDAGWVREVAAFAAFQGEADLSGGGDVSATRTFFRVGGLYRFDQSTAIGLAFGLGEQSYDFGSGADRLWADVRGAALTVPILFELGQGAEVLVAPQIRSAYEIGASGSDSMTYGVFAGISWQVSDALRIGPAFGLFSELEGDGIDAFPALIIDWQISDLWSVSTGAGIGATQGPGLRLGYAASDALNLGLEVRLENAEFRLNETGLAPGGVGEDSSVPVVFSMEYSPQPAFLVNAFVGAAFDGELTARDAAGMTVSQQSYDVAPLAGLAVQLRF
jgi:opacity protein-like surface antigen